MDFPNLNTANSKLTSPETGDYNCIGWAAGETDRWWWPNPNPPYYWPANIPLEETRQSFEQAFATLGYEPCGDGMLEIGYERVVLYCNGTTPTHMARQLPTGEWTSKLGQSFDISHSTPDVVADGVYGQIAQFFRRQN